MKSMFTCINPVPVILALLPIWTLLAGVAAADSPVAAGTPGAADAATTGGAATTASTPVVEVRPHLGRPMLFIDGQPHSGFSTMTYAPNNKDYQELAGIGIDLFLIPATADYSFYGLGPAVWTGPEQYDYKDLDKSARQVLAANPKAWLIPRVYLSAPPWWMDQHPGELCVFEDGVARQNPKRLGMAEQAETRVASYASRPWREATCENLRRLIDHVQAQDYGAHVIGYHISSGITEEWMYWGFQLDQLADYSAPALAAFREWLTRRYGDDAALRQAWGDPAVTLATAAISTGAQRRAEVRATLRNPATDRPIVDYNIFLSDLTAETILEFGRAIKEKTNNTKIVGAFYGYMTELGWYGVNMSPSGHLGVDRMMDQPWVDYFCSPSSYSFRQPGGMSLFMSLTDSLRRHGKLWMDENDYRTFLAPDHTPQHGYVTTLEQTVALQWRELGCVLAHGAGMWWFNMTGGWYGDPRLLAEMKRELETGRRAAEMPYQSVAEVAVVIDPLTPAWTTQRENFHGLAMTQAKRAWGLLGAPYELLSLKDYAAGQGGPYKMAIFANLLNLTPGERAALMARLAREHTLALWQYGAGYFDDGVLAADGIGRLTGITVAAIDTPTSAGLAIRATTDTAARVAPTPQFTLDLPICPRFVIQPGEGVHVGATYGDTGQPALAWRELADGRLSVYAAVPVLAPEWLRALAQVAGVHLYTDEPAAIQASRGWVGLHAAVGANAPQDGDYLVRLPHPARVERVVHPQPAGEPTQEVHLKLAAGESELLRLEPVE